MTDQTDETSEDLPEPEETKLMVEPEILTGHAAAALQYIYAQTNNITQMLATNMRQIAVLKSMAAHAEDQNLGNTLAMIEQQYQSSHTVLQTAQQAIAAQSAPQNQPAD